MGKKPATAAPPPRWLKTRIPSYKIGGKTVDRPDVVGLSWAQLQRADRILGEGVPGGLGYWLAGGGDLDGDGYDDLAAASGAAIGGDHYYWQGAVYVYRGGP